MVITDDISDDNTTYGNIPGCNSCIKPLQYIWSNSKDF